MYKEFQQFASDLVCEAGEILKKDFYQVRPTPEVDEKGVHLQIDREIEQLIRGKIMMQYPEHGFLGEEEGGNGKESEYKWIVDPIDGTSNYFCHNPFFCVSIALTHNDKIVVGVIDTPILGETYAVTKDGDLEVTTASKRSQGLLSAPPKLGGDNKKTIIKPETVSFDKIVIGGRSYAARCNNVESLAIKDDKTYTKIEMGAAALELAYIASGRLQAYVVEGIKDWDVAAGVLMVRETGGIVVNWQGEDWDFGDAQMMAGRKDIVKKLLLKTQN